MCHYDYSKLKGKITEVFGTQGKFAIALNKPNSYVSKYLNGKATFTQNTILIWAEKLGISADLIGDYFFALKVDKRTLF